MIQVLKFGGSSVANATNISRVLDIVGEAAKKGKVVLICSAIKGCTDSLLALARLAERQHLEIPDGAEGEKLAVRFAEDLGLLGLSARQRAAFDDLARVLAYAEPPPAEPAPPAAEAFPMTGRSASLGSAAPQTSAAASAIAWYSAAR